jgi:parallel beta-helix repeat protein
MTRGSRTRKQSGAAPPGGLSERQRTGKRVVVALVLAGALGALGGLAPAASADTTVTCGDTISAPGDYFLAGDCFGAGITITASDVTLDLNGHTMTGLESGVGVLVDDSAGAIAHVAITGPGTITIYRIGVQLGSGGAGVSDSSVSGLTANHNDFDGILLLGASGNTVADNTASHNSAFGISLGRASGNTVADNTATNNIAGGIAVFPGASGNTIDDNTATNNISDGIVLFTAATGNTVDDNTTNTNGDVGIFLFGASGNTVADNTASHNGNVGIFLFGGGTGNTIDDNTALGNAVFDLFDGNVPGCDSNTWTDNTFNKANPPCIH